MLTLQDLCGAKYDEAERRELKRQCGTFSQVASNLIGGAERDTFLWRPLLKVHPSWRRGAQGIGDCAVAGTLVLMADGTRKPIETVKKGEWVRSHTGAARIVLDTIVKPYTGELVTLKAPGIDEVVTMTPDHRFVSEDSTVESPGSTGSTTQWSPINTLSSVDQVLRVVPEGDGFVRSFHNAIELTRTSAVTTVYCLTVDVDHSFVANGFGVSNCVSWGMELAATHLLAIQHALGESLWEAEAATEPAYGGARVEALGKRRGGRSDGATGSGGAKWYSRVGGVLLRKNYAPLTGIAEHDLTKYSAKKAKDWGDYGCGGASDNGKLDALAKRNVVGYAAAIETVAEAVAALQNGYPITIASMAGFGKMRRDANGIVRRSGSWAHQMELGGIRFFNGRPQFRCFQSWGDSCSGPDPGIEETLRGIPELQVFDNPLELITGSGQLIDLSGRVLRANATSGISQETWRRMLTLPSDDWEYMVDLADGWNPISACSWWITEEDAAWIFRNGDCWAFGGVKGFEPRDIDFVNVLNAV